MDYNSIILKNIKLLKHDVVLTCTDGTVYCGRWEDIFDAVEDEQKEFEVVISCIGTDPDHYGLYVLPESIIRSIKLKGGHEF